MQKAITLFLLSLFLAACTQTGSGTPTSSTNETPTSTPAATQAEATPLAIAVIPMDMDQELADLHQTTIYNLTQEQGFRFQTRSSLSATEVQTEPGLKIVIAFPPDPGLAALAAAAPGVQFVGVEIPGLVPGGNLSTIGGDETLATQRAFAAGYVAAMLSPDYRVGLITQESDAGLLVIQAFADGRAYYCGTCPASFPPWPPDYQYPVHPQIPESTPLTQYPAYSDYLFDRLVDVTYVDPLVATSDLLDYMAVNGMNLIGEELPLEDLRTNWVASIQPDTTSAVQAMWSDLLNGEGGLGMTLPLKLVDVNPDLLSEGKQRLVEELLMNLQEGLVTTGTAP